ncbi:hypothetical protein [Streptomyces sp. NPDC053079]|uniref:hypothetical protein n=1 Tax=Streptomyces sp. NPDC053079 TaxID=3365697 RepID=UPI0037D31769
MPGSLKTRLAVALGSLALAAAGVVVAAPAANATGPECANSLASTAPARNTTAGDLFCGVGGAGLPTVSELVCSTGLTRVSQVGTARAASACAQARR